MFHFAGTRPIKKESGMTRAVEVGVDIGGTFTDVVWTTEENKLGLMKIPTTPGNRSVAVQQALRLLQTEHGIDPGQIVRFVHGTTVATNAVLERKGAVTGLLTTEGFRDILEIGRQFRSDMYDLNFSPSAPTFLVPGARRKEVRERIDAQGEVVVPLDTASLEAAIRSLVEDGVEAIAIAFLFSFLNPQHERLAAEAVRRLAPGIAVSISSDVDPAFREYERTCVTAFDAYVKPVLRTYLDGMERDLAKLGVRAPLQIMQSRGGLSRADIACDRPVRLFLSGPAAGVIGGQSVASAVRMPDIITMDVGGTSCDIALIADDQPLIRPDGLIDGYTVRVPMVDVNAIGSGGGSIAWIDSAGGFHVGPQSAGSDPGPACYGRGGSKPTVTDASVLLGYIDPQYFADGTLSLDPEAARAVIENLASALDYTAEQAALGIHRILNAQMAEGIRAVSIQRGIDPREFTLLPLGGGGATHATAVADELQIKQVLIPPHPGVLSAMGLLSAQVEHEVSAGLHARLTDCTVTDMKARLSELDARCGALMAREMTDSPVTISHHADLCYVGQSYYLDIPIDLSTAADLSRVYRDFLQAHEKTYGHSVDGPVRVVNLRTVHRAYAGSLRQEAPAAEVDRGEQSSTRTIIVPQAPEGIEAAIWRRASIAADQVIQGPAIVEQADTTTLITPGWIGRVLADGSLLLTTNKQALK
jgi:N-methylhydantoinase A/oxoprolinase/acetone carboxylase beta subunit